MMMGERKPMAWVDAGLPWDAAFRAVMQHLTIELLCQAIPDPDLAHLRGTIQQLQAERRKADLTPTES